ncbi:hypothetical protein [Aquimarina sediminis]|uniref:hypothetical protein n=1 Tax=Aquimarina sediminis TaxID=2070536 RepID=UPI000CA05A3D|nr:hypothetical protein [Aquimarina sediminis]
MSKTLIIPIIIGALITLIGLCMGYSTHTENSEFLTHLGLWIVETAGFFLLLLNGTFIKTRYFKMVKGIVALMLLGALFSIMKWPFHRIVIVIDFVAIIVVYIISFFKKPIYKKLDCLKLGWVIVWYSGAILDYLHIINDDYRILTTVLMILAVLDFVKIKLQNKTLFD